MHSSEIYRELKTLMDDTHNASERVGSDDETFMKEYRRLAQQIESTGEGRTALEESEKSSSSLCSKHGSGHS